MADHIFSASINITLVQWINKGLSTQSVDNPFNVIGTEHTTFLLRLRYNVTYNILGLILLALVGAGFDF